MSHIKESGYYVVRCTKIITRQDALAPVLRVWNESLLEFEEIVTRLSVLYWDSNYLCFRDSQGGKEASKDWTRTFVRPFTSNDIPFQLVLTDGSISLLEQAKK